MSEHKYLMSEQIAGLRADVEQTPDVNGFRLLRALDDVDALRAGLKAAQEERAIAKRAATEYMTWLGEKTRRCLDTDEENARLRNALEEIVSGKHGIFSVYVIANRALNPQPAPPEVPKPQTFREGHPVYVCRQCSKQYKEHGQNEECPVGAQSEVKPK